MGDSARNAGGEANTAGNRQASSGGRDVLEFQANAVEVALEAL